MVDPQHPLERRVFWGKGCLLQAITPVVFLFCLGLVSKISIDPDAEASLWSLVPLALASVATYFVWHEGARQNIGWFCPECGRQLPSPDVKVCLACKTRLSL